MQEFDYSNETSNDLYDAVDGLSYEEAVFAKAAIEKIKEEKEEKKVMKFKKWFNEALFPILNEFAAASVTRISVLTVSRNSPRSTWKCPLWMWRIFSRSQRDSSSICSRKC